MMVTNSLFLWAVGALAPPPDDPNALGPMPTIVASSEKDIEALLKRAPDRARLLANPGDFDIVAEKAATMLISRTLYGDETWNAAQALLDRLDAKGPGAVNVRDLSPAERRQWLRVMLAGPLGRRPQGLEKTTREGAFHIGLEARIKTSTGETHSLRFDGSPPGNAPAPPPLTEDDVAPERPVVFRFSPGLPTVGRRMIADAAFRHIEKVREERLAKMRPRIAEMVGKLVREGLAGRESGLTVGASVANIDPALLERMGFAQGAPALTTPGMTGPKQAKGTITQITYDVIVSAGGGGASLVLSLR